tara:strand:+ start:2367 stop:2633 length:267 start_codon:yes stop_codon:yes gene_type:complete
MPSRLFKKNEYNITSTFHEDGSSTHALETIVGEGETPVKAFRTDLDTFCPETLVEFESQDETIEWLITCPNSVWSPWYELPEPEEEEE